MNRLIHCVFSMKAFDFKAYDDFLHNAFEDYFIGEYSLRNNSLQSRILVTPQCEIEIRMNVAYDLRFAPGVKSNLCIFIDELTPTTVGEAWDLLVLLSLTEDAKQFLFWISTYKSLLDQFKSHITYHVIDGQEGYVLDYDAFNTFYDSL